MVCGPPDPRYGPETGNECVQVCEVCRRRSEAGREHEGEVSSGPCGGGGHTRAERAIFFYLFFYFL